MPVLSDMRRTSRAIRWMVFRRGFVGALLRLHGRMCSPLHPPPVWMHRHPWCCRILLKIRSHDTPRTGCSSSFRVQSSDPSLLPVGRQAGYRTIPGYPHATPVRGFGGAHPEFRRGTAPTGGLRWLRPRDSHQAVALPLGLHPAKGEPGVVRGHGGFAPTRFRLRDGKSRMPFRYVVP